MEQNNPKKQPKSESVMQHRAKLSKNSTFANQLQSRDKYIFNDFIPFGLAFFGNEILQPENLLYFPEVIFQEMSYNHLEIRVNSQDESIMWEKRLSFIKEYQVSGLCIKKIEKSSFNCFVFNCIEHIGFPQLLVLNLYSCRITNIEVLAHLDAPNLRNVNLIYNQIYTFKSFGKSPFFLQSLHLMSTSESESTKRFIHRNWNAFLQHKMPVGRAFLQNYSRWNFPLRDFRLEKHIYNEVGMNDLSFLAKGKLQKSQLEEQRVNMKTQRRIKQERVIKSLKNTGMNFYVSFKIDQFEKAQALDRQGLYKSLIN